MAVHSGVPVASWTRVGEQSRGARASGFAILCSVAFLRKSGARRTLRVRLPQASQRMGRAHKVKIGQPPRLLLRTRSTTPVGVGQGLRLSPLSDLRLITLTFA